MSEEIKSYSKSVNQVDKDIELWLGCSKKRSRYSRIDTHHIAIILLTRCAKMGYILKLPDYIKREGFKKFNTRVGFKQTSSCMNQMLLIMSPPTLFYTLSTIQTNIQ